MAAVTPRRPPGQWVTCTLAAHTDSDTRQASVAAVLARVWPEPADQVARADASFIAEELLDNALRDANGASVRLTMGIRSARVVIRTSNDVPTAQMTALLAHLARLFTTDAEDALAARVEANAHETNAAPDRPTARSGLGLLTLRADYGVALDVRARPSVRSGFSVLEVRATWPQAPSRGTDVAATLAPAPPHVERPTRG